MGERVAKKMGVETRELKRMSFSGEIRSNVKVTSISAEQRQSAREAKVEKSPIPKNGAKKVAARPRTSVEGVRVAAGVRPR